MEEIFLILVGIAWALGTPLIAIMALVRTSGLRRQNDRLASELAALRRYKNVPAAILLKLGQDTRRAEC